MTAGDLVTARYMPHLGTGVIEFAADGRALVSFEVDGEPYKDDFAFGELEAAKPLVVRTG